MVEVDSFFIQGDVIKTNITYKNAKGTLREIKHSCYDYDLWSAEPPVENVFKDFPIIEEYFFGDPSELDYTEIERAYVETGDSGICEGIVGNTFFEFLTSYRKGGAVQVIFDLQDYPDFFRPLQKRYTAYLSGIAEEICRRTSVEGIFLNCGSATLTVIGPNFFKEWDIPLVEAVGEVAKRHNRIFHYHLHGKGRALLDDLAGAGITMICPLEDPPRGDFKLSEVKKSFGSRMGLKGGVDPFLLRESPPEDIEKRVKRCIDEGASNGGYTLATGDGVLKETPFENIRLMVETSEKYGKY